MEKTTFKDASGREWTITLSLGDVNRVATLAKLDINDLLPKNEKDTTAHGVLMRLITDASQICNVVYASIKPRVDEAGLSKEQFFDVCSGSAVEQMRDCFLQAIHDFFPNPVQKRAILLVLQRGKMAMEAAAERMEIEINKTDARAEIDKALDTALSKRLATN